MDSVGMGGVRLWGKEDPNIWSPRVIYFPFTPTSSTPNNEG